MTSSDVDMRYLSCAFTTNVTDHEVKYPIDVDLCNLMQTMKLDPSREKGVRIFHLSFGFNDP